MADNTLAVKITADIVDLQTKFAIARANVQGLTSEMNALARASAKGLIDPAGSARLQQVAGDLLHARGEAAALSGAMNAAGVSAVGMGSSFGGAEVHVGSVAREMRRLFNDIRSGSMGGAEVGIIRLASSLLGLSPAALVAVGAIAALTAGLGFLIARSIETENALGRILVGAQAAGNFDITTEAVKKFAEEMAQGANISHSASLTIASDLARIPGIGIPGLQAAAADMNAFVGATGIDADKVGAAYAKLLDPDVDASRFRAQMKDDKLAIDDLGRSALEAAERTGDANQIMAAKEQVIHNALAGTLEQQQKNNAGLYSSIRTWFDYSAAELAGVSVEERHTQLLAEEKQKQDALNQSSREGIALKAKTAQSPQQALDTGLSVAKEENPISAQIDAANTKITELKAGLKEAEAAGDSLNVKLLSDSLASAKEKLDALQFGPVAARMQASMQEIAATWDGTQSGMLAKQREVAAGFLSQTRANSAQYLDIQKEMSRLDTDIKRATAEEGIAAVRRENEQIAGDESRTEAQRLAAQRENLEQELTNVKFVGDQKLAIEQEIASKTAEINKQAAEQTKAIDRETLDNSVALAKINIESERTALDTQLALHQINATQKLQILKNLTTEEAAENLKQAQAYADQVAKDPAAAQVAADKILQIKAKLNADLNQLDRQHAADAARAAEQEVTAWKQAVGEIETAETSMLQNLLTKKKSFGAAAYEAAGRLADQEIEADVRAVTTRLIWGDNEEGIKKAQEQGGIAYHEYAEQTKTTESGTAASQRTGINTQATAQQNAEEQTVPQTTATVEAQKTAAATTGSSTRTGITTAEVSRGQTEEQTVPISHAAVEAQKTAASQTGAAARTSVDTIEVTRGTTLDQTSVGTHTASEAQKTAATQTGATVRTGSETTAQAAQRTVEQVGVGAHSTAEIEKTGATHVGVAQRTAADNTESTNFFGSLGTIVARWFGTEQAKTGATTAGAITRTTEQGTADATTTSEAALAGAAQIEVNAAVAATAAGASVAVIPVYGWAAAPEVAAETYADMLAYAAALDVGAWDVPQDMNARIHQGESVMPRDFASGYRATVGGAGGRDQGKGGDQFGDTNVTNHFHQTMPSTDKIVAHLRKAVRNAHPATLR